GAGAGYTNPFAQIYEVPGMAAGTTAMVGYRMLIGTDPAGTPALRSEVMTETTLLNGTDWEALTSNGVLGRTRCTPANTNPRTFSFCSGIGPRRAAPLLLILIRIILAVPTR